MLEPRMRHRMLVMAAIVLVAVLVSSWSPEGDLAGAGANKEKSQFLKKVQQRGFLRCGVTSEVPGFGFPGPGGQLEGFDIDFCRALAVAIFNDDTSVEYVPVTWGERFTALQDGDIDVLIAVTTWTASRDSEFGDFTGVTFYGGTNIVVPTASDIGSVDDLHQKDICVVEGTTARDDVALYLAAHGVYDYVEVPFLDLSAAVDAYYNGDCDALAFDVIGLVGVLTGAPGEHVLLFDYNISKDPLGPMVAHGDQGWADIVRWVVNGMIIAEELGVDSGNVGAPPPGSDVDYLLGVQGDVGVKLGLENNFMVNVISKVGNYGEVYDEHLEPLGLTREGSLNALWTEGGILYAPPMR